jgi:hypothetical protein
MAVDLNTYTRTADWLPARRVCCGADPVGQLLQPLEMLIGENTGSSGKNFQDARDLAIAVDRDDCDRADSDRPRNLGVNTAIGCDVATAE